MRAKWTGEIVKQLHVYEITQQELAEELGIASTYVSALLNGRRTSPKMYERMKNAVQTIVDRK